MVQDRAIVIVIVSYSPSIVTMTVSAVILEIFSVKEWPDHENRVRVHSRSLEMAPFDIAYESKYLSCLHTRSVQL